jgi:hypothetical protein
MGFKSYTKFFSLFFSLSALVVMLAANARPANAQSFDAGAEKKLRFGVNLLKFKNVPVGETSDTQNVVITTSQKTITLDSIEVKEPFIETDCSCVFLANNVGTVVDCDNESLPLDLPGFDAATGQQPTTCKVGVAFQPDSAGRVDNPFGMRIDFGARNTPKHVRLLGVGVE